MARHPDPEMLLAALHQRAQGKKLVLHLASGPAGSGRLHPFFTADAWFEIRCDNDRRSGAHIIAGMHQLTMLPEKCIDAIWLNHALERLEATQVAGAMAGWFRLLKDEGALRLTATDLRAVAAHIAHGRLEEALYTNIHGPVSGLDLLYGRPPGATHRTGFTAETLARRLLDAQFNTVTIQCAALSLGVEAYKYPEGHPLRREGAHIRRDSGKDVTPPPAPPLARQRHPGALWPNRPTDALDVPPTPV